LILLGMLAVGAEAAEPKRVLLIYSSSRDFAPADAVANPLRAELERQLEQPVAFHEIWLEARRAGPPMDERHFREFLHLHYGGERPDLVVAFSLPALRFYLRDRESLFPEARLLVTSIDKRRLEGVKLGPGDRVVSASIDIPRIATNILEVLPETHTLAVVMGSSRTERFWLAELKDALAPLASRVQLVWLHDLTLGELRRRAAALSSGSAILYMLFNVDAEGVPFENDRALAEVRGAASVPVFGMFDRQFGAGIVGGPLVELRTMGTLSGQVARRMLDKADGAEAAHVVIDTQSPVFDWRELQRWGIPESRLPAGASVRFRPPTLWQEHKLLISAGSAIVLLQAALIAALLFQRARRRSAEKEAIGLSGRLLTAHEDERRRLARELHDDLTQRLARLAIDAGRIERGGGKEPAEVMGGALREDLVRLSEDVHALSYRLHPAVLDELGLVEALKAECDRLSRRESVSVSTDMHDVPVALPADTALCLFRVAQEALRNAARHARASAVMVFLAPRGGGLQLAVCDDGSGFDPASHRQSPSLGIQSMRERVRLTGGELDIESTPGHGTTVVAWVPLAKVTA
jgi:signal transduction histidine kinase